MSGYRHSDEAKLKMRTRAKTRKPRPHTPETRAKIGAGRHAAHVRLLDELARLREAVSGARELTTIEG